MRTQFDEQLGLLSAEMTTMGALCESAIAASARALGEGTVPESGGAVDFSARICEKERGIEAMCMRLLLQQQPVAKDLRVISSALKMVTDMERIGISSADITEIVAMRHITASHDRLNIPDMAAATMRMVSDSIDAFVRNDLERARAVIAYDDVVDEHFDRAKRQLIGYLGRPGADGEYALDLLMIAKYFERIGDHATNIAGWVAFSILGHHVGKHEA